MKKLLSLTAAALLLITTGCGRSNAPSASASSTAPSVSAPITEPTVESSDDTAPTVQKDEAAAKPQNSRRLDDSRIIPLYSERFTYTDPYGILITPPSTTRCCRCGCCTPSGRARIICSP